MSSIKLKHSGGNSVSLNPPTNAPTSSDVAFKLPNADGSANQVIKTDGSGNLSFVAQPTGGLSMVDMWHVTSQTTFQAETAAANWGRSTGTIAGCGHIGSAMTNSGQYFTFPETGIYEIEYQTLCYTSATESRYVASFIYVTTDNSNYNKRARGYAAVHQDSSQTTFSFGVKFIFDVTDTSTHKVYFANLSEATATLEFADLTNDIIRSYALFKKLGDT